jgi:hypothetical protein
MKIENRTLHSVINEAIKKAEELLKPDSVMMKEIRAKNDWTYTSDTGEQIYQKVLSNEKTFLVFTYRPWNIFSSAIAYYQNDKVYFNIRKLSNNVDDILATILHECVGHGSGYGHGSNYYNSSKANSFPYWLSLNVKKWL